MSLLWRSAREKADAARYAIKQFVIEAAKAIPEGALVIDAGAGNCRYRPFFKGHHYVGLDFCQVSGKKYKGIGIVTDLTAMAILDDCVDAIVNIEVLEHIPEPLTMLREFQRVLKPGGSLYLTCPLIWGVHEAPYDFFRFTPFSLQKLMHTAGFEMISIKPKGGYFWMLAKILSRLPFQITEPREGRLRKFAYWLAFPILKEIFFYWVPYALFHLDFLDRRKDFTLGYLCHATKPLLVEKLTT